MVAGVVLINLFVFGMVAFSLNQRLAALEARVELTAQSLSRLLAHDIGGSIDKIDVALLFATDEIERQIGGGIDERALNEFLARLQGRLPEIFSLRVTDANGIVRYGSGVNPSARQNNSDREYFFRQRDDFMAGLVIAKPVFTRIDKKWAVPISRAIHLPDGSFGGVVYVNLSLERLVKTFADIDVGRRGSVSLRDAEMRIFARYPVPANFDKVMGETLVVPELQELIRTGRDDGTYISDHTVDGVERKFGVHRIPEYPLYAVIGLATDEYVAWWRDQAIRISLLVALFSMTTLIAARLIYRSRKRELAAMTELAREEEKFHTVADFTHDWEYWLGPDQREILYMTPSCERVTGYSSAEFVAAPDLLKSITHPDDRPMMEEHQHHYAERSVQSADFRILPRDGQIRWIAHACQPVYRPNGDFLGRRVSNRDITERKSAEKQILQLAYFDTLTGLPNRRMLLDRLDQALSQAKRFERSLAIMFLDLDNFKTINDTLGHHTGDELLKQVADRLAACVRSSDTVSRQGGDEFVIVLPEIAHPQDAARVAEKAVKALSVPVRIADQTLQVTVSIGIAVQPVNGTDDARELMKKADTAMYAAKAAGRNGYRFFSD
jgi:diguanylate cyclase (GGDEF)-like protein/PAS domain S-box-containing protein